MSVDHRPDPLRDLADWIDAARAADLADPAACTFGLRQVAGGRNPAAGGTAKARLRSRKVRSVSS
jgi:hypothetical protein